MEKKKPPTVLFWIGFVLAALIWVLVFELGKNTLWGWALLLVWLIAWPLLRFHFFGAYRFLPRLGLWLAGGILLPLGLYLLSWPPIRSIPAVTCKNPKPTGEITLAQGRLTGVYTEDEAVEVYAGIPYAKPPVGELRWREPQEPEPWEGLRACDTFAPMSMQKRNHPIFDSLARIFVYHTYKISLTDNWLEPMSEDSLYLNIWKPAGKQEKLPVLVYIHGGSLTSGQPSYSEYNGEAIARRGVIVVNFGYRLNIFGFYADEALAAESPNGTTGNYGLLDQIQALRWVRENIAAFGGDPEQVTLAGESAGASCVNALCVSPLSKGLFCRAIAESSGVTAKKPYHTFRSMEKALELGRSLRQSHHFDDLDEMRAIPAQDLVDFPNAYNSMTVDGYVLPQEPWKLYEQGANHEQALLQGFNVHEADLFSLGVKVEAGDYAEKLRPLYGDWAEEAAQAFPPAPQEPYYHYLIDPGGNAKGSYDAAVSAAWFSYSHYNWARLLAPKGVPVYSYYFTKDNGSLGSNHAGELPYFYGNLAAHPQCYDSSDEALSETMLSYYVNFIKTGDPNGHGLPHWPSWAEAPEQLLELGAEIRVIPDPYLKLYALIDKFQEQ